MKQEGLNVSGVVGEGDSFMLTGNEARNQRMDMRRDSEPEIVNRGRIREKREPVCVPEGMRH